jgi:hypothetical protein
MSKRSMGGGDMQARKGSAEGTRQHRALNMKHIITIPQNQSRKECAEWDLHHHDLQPRRPQHELRVAGGDGTCRHGMGTSSLLTRSEAPDRGTVSIKTRVRVGRVHDRRLVVSESGVYISGSRRAHVRCDPAIASEAASSESAYLPIRRRSRKHRGPVRAVTSLISAEHLERYEQPRRAAVEAPDRYGSAGVSHDADARCKLPPSVQGTHLPSGRDRVHDPAYRDRINHDRNDSRPGREARECVQNEECIHRTRFARCACQRPQGCLSPAGRISHFGGVFDDLVYTCPKVCKLESATYYIMEVTGTICSSVHHILAMTNYSEVALTTAARLPRPDLTLRILPQPISA